MSLKVITMTPQEFEDYLVSIGGLENGYYTDRPPIMRRSFCACGEGWLQLIHDLIEELLAIGWNKQARQIKEKFGGLRFYAEVPEGGDEIVRKYEQLSYQTCEVCGKPAEVRIDRAWTKTLCDEHDTKESA